MDKPVEILRECNQILLRLHDVNKHQIQQMRKGDFNKLEIFSDKRQAILEMLDIVEEQLDRRLGFLPNDQKQEMAEELNFRKEILQGILYQEIDLHKLVEQEKARTMLSIQANKKNRKAVTAYKSENTKTKTITEV